MARPEDSRGPKITIRSGRLAKKFTRAEQRRIRACILARRMTFRVFLPESTANWLRKKIRTGVFQDPAEAANVA